VARSNSASSIESAGAGGAGQPIRVPVLERDWTVHRTHDPDAFRSLGQEAAKRGATGGRPAPEQDESAEKSRPTASDESGQESAE